VTVYRGKLMVFSILISMKKFKLYVFNANVIFELNVQFREFSLN
jgi:hypothetical protein